jgi:hypothetical protein
MNVSIFRSEANDLAIRLAREYTGNYDIITLDKYVKRKNISRKDEFYI